MRHFHKRNIVSRLAPEQIERQGRISRLAFEALGQPAEAICAAAKSDWIKDGRQIIARCRQIEINQDAPADALSGDQRELMIWNTERTEDAS